MTTQSPTPSSKPAILIVEDDPNLRIGLQDNLQDEGYEVAAAASAAEADTLLRSRTFDLLILDVMLPGEDGYSLCRRLRVSRSSSTTRMFGCGWAMLTFLSVIRGKRRSFFVSGCFWWPSGNRG